MLTWSSTATLIGTVAGRDWLIPPGYGLWVPGGIEHAGAVLYTGEMLTVTFAADRCPTLSRLFRAETGLSFATWRAHVRVRAAVPLLAGGTSVSATARAVGYRKPSAFRRVTGQTPGTYLSQRR
jgi:hypothetical protein